jgi:iron(II)-dependent oxidoreductase
MVVLLVSALAGCIDQEMQVSETAGQQPSGHPGLPAESAADSTSNAAWEQAGTQTGQVIAGPSGIALVWVPSGSFMMGSTDADVDYAVQKLNVERETFQDEQPAHEVKLSGFWIGKTEVTVGQWLSVMGAVPGYFNNQGNDYPLVEMTWNQAKEFCDRLDLDLPTEAQWEYAARGPDNHRYPWGDEWDEDKCSNIDIDKSGGWPFPVGTFPSGASWCGALDMAGNMWEWCADWYDSDYYASSLAEDPPGPASGDDRVLRGSSWRYSACRCRSASRFHYEPTDAHQYYFGLRVAKNCR